MKKSKATALIAASFAMAMGLSACGSDDGKKTGKSLSKLKAPFQNSDRTQTVYGPPTDYDPSADDPVDVYGPPADYTGETETEVVGLYGPPIDYEDLEEG